MTTSDADAPSTPLPAGTGHQEPGSVPEDGFELFPVNFTCYRHDLLPDLDTETHVRAIADLLSPYGLVVNRWAVPEKDRDRQAVEERLGDWKRLTASHRGNTVLYWVGHGSAEHLAHHRTAAPIDDGIHPEEVARAIGRRRLHPDAQDSWAIVVLDACFSKDFARKVHRTLIAEYDDADRFLLLSTAAKGHTELGDFTRALRHALTVTFLGQRTIGLAELGSQLARDLDGYRGDHVDDHRDRLVRTLPDVASAVSAPLDQIAELQAVIEQLPTDEQRHFLTKASGAELGELAWYFHGRTQERDTILHWLATATRGALIVTGPAGSGKSALLGHILNHTNPRLRDVLIRHRHLQSLSPNIPCPDDPFDLTVHLSGLTLTRTIQAVAQAADLPDLARLAADGNPPADLAARLFERIRHRNEPLTLLFDALDEAEQPLTLADTLLRHLAALPQVRIIIGTRRSTREGPDQPAPDDTDILDALRTRTDETRPRYVEVTQDQDALAGYLGAKLDAARQRGSLDTDDATVAAAVRRLITDRQQLDAEPQQFLYVRLAAHELLNDPTLLTNPTPLVGRTHRQLFAHALERLHRVDPGYAPLLRALGLAQGRGLPDQDGIWTRAANALNSDGTGEVGGSISGLVRDAAPYLALDQEHGQSVYRLAHRTFSEHFTVAPNTPAAHTAITSALARDARDPSGDTATQPGNVSPYIRHHLITHARLGHAAGALQVLANHPDVLDALDLTGIAATALHHGLPPNEIPPAIAGTVLLQNHAQQTDSDRPDHNTIGWRRWWRRLGTTYIQGNTPPAEAHTHTPQTWPPALTSGAVSRRHLHRQLTGHNGSVDAVAVFTAPDGTPRLATGGNDRTVRIWNPVTGDQDGEPLTGHTGAVRAVAVYIAPDGTPRLATNGYDGMVRTWNPATGIEEGAPLTAHGNWVGAVAVFTAPDGTPRLATGGYDGMVRIWNPVTGDQDGEPLTGHTGAVRAVAVFTAPDSTPRLVTGDGVGTVRIWNPVMSDQDGEPLTGHTGAVNAVAISPDGTWLAAAGYDGTVWIWNTATGTRDGRALYGPILAVGAVAVFTAPDGTPRLATGGGDGMVRIWNPVTGDQDGEPLTGHTGAVRAVAVFTAPDSTPRLATGSNDRTVRIWNPATSIEEGASLTDHGGLANAVAVFTALDGTPRLATIGYDQMIRIWNLVTGDQDGEFLTGQGSWVNAMAVFTAPDSTPRLVTGGGDRTVRIWNPVTGDQDGEFLTGHTGAVSAVAVFTAPDGTPRLATIGYDQMVRIWNLVTGDQDGEFLTGQGSWVNAVTVFTAPDGTPRLVTGGGDGMVRIWNPVTGDQDGEFLTGNVGDVSAVAVFTAPDGTPRLIIGSEDGTVRIWNPVTGTQEGAPLTDHGGLANAVTVFTAPDGTSRLATGGDDQAVWIWNPVTRTSHTLLLADRIRQLTEHRGLLIAGTDSGYLAIDISALPTGTA